MASDRWQELERLFLRLRREAGSDLDAALLEVAEEDAELAAHVRTLLDAAGRAGDFLEGSAGLEEIGDHAAAPVEREAIPRPESNRPDAVLSPGDRLGAYRILGPLGAGGMSTVYLAERADRAYRQRVAVKVIGGGWLAPGMEERFQAERQILASLVHPNIARLLDGGATPQGRPYLVLELVEGEPVDAFCDRRRLNVGERLELFSKVCAAVGAAHRSLVVHRDLKPSNILVTAAGEPKLLDFGIAKLLQPDPSDEVVPTTQAWARLLTPRYASPEQLRGERVTTASDVYSLGLLLYQLLAGHSPWPPDASTGTLMEERSAQVPPAPSALLAVRTADRQLEARQIAELRSSPLQALRRQLEGDLDAVVLKALEPEPERRYASVEPLKEDLRRFLTGFPVRARPAGRLYRIRRFLGRHRWPAAVTALLVVLVLALAGTTTLQSWRLAKERDEALAAQKRSREVVGFLQDVFRVAMEEEELTVRQAVSRSAASLETKLLDQPRVRADLLEVIGNIYRHLGAYDEAERQLTKALAIRRDLFGDESLSVATLLGSLGPVKAWLDRLEEGEQAARRAVAIVERAQNPDPRVETAVLNQLVGLLCLRGDLAAAEDPSLQAAVLAASRLGDLEVEKAQAMANRARVLTGTGRYAEALSLYRDAIRLQRQSQGPDHPEVVTLLNNLALAYRHEGQFEDALKHMEEAVALLRRLGLERSPSFARSLKILGDLHLGTEDLESAEAAYEESRRLIEEISGPGHYAVLVNLAGIASVELRRGQAEQAEALLAGWLGVWGSDLRNPYHRGLGESVLGEALTSQGRFSEAEPLLQRSYQAILQHKGEGSIAAQQAHRRLLDLYGAWGKPAPPGL